MWDDPQKHRRQREMQRRTSVRRNKGRECKRDWEVRQKKRDEEQRHTFSITPHEKVFSTASFALWEQKERVRLQLYFIYPSSSPPSLLFIHHHTHSYRLREMTEALWLPSSEVTLWCQTRLQQQQTKGFRARESD